MTKKEYELIEWLLSEYDWSSADQTKAEFIAELKKRVDDE